VVRADSVATDEHYLTVKHSHKNKDKCDLGVREATREYYYSQSYDKQAVGSQ